MMHARHVGRKYCLNRDKLDNIYHTILGCIDDPQHAITI